jgi:hypothetical protein
MPHFHQPDKYPINLCRNVPFMFTIFSNIKFIHNINKYLSRRLRGGIWQMLDLGQGTYTRKYNAEIRSHERKLQYVTYCMSYFYSQSTLLAENWRRTIIGQWEFGGLETDGHFLAGLENRRAVQTKCGSEQNSLTNRLTSYLTHYDYRWKWLLIGSEYT